MVTHGWWGNKFCKRTCKNAYLRKNHHTLSGWVIPRLFAFAYGAHSAAGRYISSSIALPPQRSRRKTERSFTSPAKRPVAAGSGGARGALPELSRGIEFQWNSHCRNFPRRKGYRARK
jgi:hypothetical protein